jgi:hypothetical protein
VTEGFGIVAPLAADVTDGAGDGSATRPSWWFLLGLGVIGGGPTFLGTVVGHGFTSEALSVMFLTLTAGSLCRPLHRGAPQGDWRRPTYARLSSKAKAAPTDTKLAATVDTRFKGETLRGLLLNAYGFATIAGIAAICAFIGAAIMLVLSQLRFAHLRRVRQMRSWGRTARPPAPNHSNAGRGSRLSPVNRPVKACFFVPLASARLTQ